MARIHTHQLAINLSLWSSTHGLRFPLIRLSFFVLPSLRSLRLLKRVSAFFSYMYRRGMAGISLRYGSKLQFPFISNIFQAGYLLSIKAGVQVLLFLILIPVVGKWLMASRGLLPKLRDLRIAQWSILLSCGGALTIGVAPRVWNLIVGTHHVLPFHNHWRNNTS